VQYRRLRHAPDAQIMLIRANDPKGHTVVPTIRGDLDFAAPTP
jgi:hypothetical protein